MVDIQVIDEQNVLDDVAMNSLRDFSRELSSELEIDHKEISIFLADGEIVGQLNKEFRNLDETTDVLSFNINSLEDDDPLLGEIIIDLYRAKEQAAEFEVSVLREISFLIMHGVLHLCGYDHDADHQGEMRQLEESLEHLLLP